MTNSAKDVLRIAAAEIGYYRHNDPETGTKYGRWYAQAKGGAAYAANGVPFCAMFASWVFDQAGAKCVGLPEAYCPYILNAAKSAGKVLADKTQARPGDIVLFQWDSGVVDHVGIVELNKGSYIQTIEGNSPAGYVQRHTRKWGVVAAIVRPDFDGSTSSNTTTATTSSGKVAVDGWIGAASTREWQSQLGTTVDGIISGQSTSDRAAHERVASIQYGSGGSQMVKALQNFLNAKGGYGLTADGYMGAKTVTALQQWMRDKLGYTKHAIDGVLGQYTAYNVQNALNAGAFRK